jgi:hypothetical protein
MFRFATGKCGKKSQGHLFDAYRIFNVQKVFT